MSQSIVLPDPRGIAKANRRPSPVTIASCIFWIA